MRRIIALLVVAVPVALFPSPEPASEPAGDAGRGREAFAQRCVNCHHAGDPTVRRDQIWTALIGTST